MLTGVAESAILKLVAIATIFFFAFLSEGALITWKTKKKSGTKGYPSIHHKPAGPGSILRINSYHSDLLPGNRNYRFQGRHCIDGHVGSHNSVSPRCGISAGQLQPLSCIPVVSCVVLPVVSGVYRFSCFRSTDHRPSLYGSCLFGLRLSNNDAGR